MTDLKLLFSRYFSHKRILIGVAAFFLLMMAAVMLFHEDPGGDPADFIMCKFSALMPMMMAVCLPVIFMVQDTIGNRFMRSVPCADKLYTRGIPLFSMLVPLGWSVLSNAVYAAFILLTGQYFRHAGDDCIVRRDIRAGRLYRNVHTVRRAILRGVLCAVFSGDDNRQFVCK